MAALLIGFALRPLTFVVNVQRKGAQRRMIAVTV